MLPEVVQNLINKAREVRRGCSCDYDYRCGRCQAVIDLHEALVAVESDTQYIDSKSK